MHNRKLYSTRASFYLICVYRIRSYVRKGCAFLCCVTGAPMLSSTAGAIFLDVKAQHRWSGTPITSFCLGFRVYQIQAFHLSDCPGAATRNLAGSGVAG